MTLQNDQYENNIFTFKKKDSDNTESADSDTLKEKIKFLKSFTNQSEESCHVDFESISEGNENVINARELRKNQTDEIFKHFASIVDYASDWFRTSKTESKKCAQNFIQIIRFTFSYCNILKPYKYCLC